MTYASLCQRWDPACSNPLSIIVRSDEVTVLLRMGLEAFKLHADERLKSAGATGYGRVHTWKYVNGDVRCTFQPGKP